MNATDEAAVEAGAAERPARHQGLVHGLRGH